MSILYLLIPIAVLFLIIAVAFFFWAIRNDQYSDLESPALKIVIEDHHKKSNSHEDDNGRLIDKSAEQNPKPEISNDD